MILLGPNSAAVPARPACCYCQYDSRYAGNMFGGGIGFCFGTTADTHLHPEKGAEQLHCNDIHSFCFYRARGCKQGE